MDEGLKSFLEKFAELERRIRKLAAEDRALKEEISELRAELDQANSDREEAERKLEKERGTRKKALRMVDELIEKLESTEKGEETSSSRASEKTKEGEAALEH